MLVGKVCFGFVGEYVVTIACINEEIVLFEMTE